MLTVTASRGRLRPLSTIPRHRGEFVQNPPVTGLVAGQGIGIWDCGFSVASRGRKPRKASDSPGNSGKMLSMDPIAVAFRDRSALGAESQLKTRRLRSLRFAREADSFVE